MSGVFGLIDVRRESSLATVLQEMTTCMRHCPWHVLESWHDPAFGVGLGRIGIGILNRETQPVTSADGMVRVFLAGEFYETEPVFRELERQGVTFRTKSHAELLLRLYQEQGAALVHDLTGAFIAAIWDARRQQVLLISDRFGLYPTYYSRQRGRLVFAPEVKGVLCDPALQPTLDLSALAQYMRFQQLLGERTFFNKVSLLPPATVLCFNLQSGETSLNRYWDLDAIPTQPLDITFEEAVVETGRLLRQAVRRLTDGPHRPGVYLSGGLDSRTVLGLATAERGPTVSITYGARRSRDVVYAKRIASTVNSPHHFFPFENGHWVSEYADFHLQLTEGFHSWIHAHGISTLKTARDVIDVNLTGWDGGTILGDPDTIGPTLNAPVDEMALLGHLFHRFNQCYTWPGITEAEERMLYRDDFYPEVRGRAFETLKQELSRTAHYAPHNRVAFFYLLNHCRRLTQHMITFARSHIEVRFPFHDPELFDFVYALAPELRGHKRLYRAVLSRELPRLSRIPYERDQFLPTDRRPLRFAHGAVVKARRLVNQHIKPIFDEPATLYADYETWLRTDLRPWAEALLFDPRTLERGILNPDFVRSIWARHQSGTELWTIGKIAPLMTVEMMLRRWYD